MQLRDYQEDGLQALWSYFMTKKGNPVVAWPTGTGKSLLPAEFIRRTMRLYPRQRFLLATHVKELIRQNFEELIGNDEKPGIWPGAPAGIYSAGLKRRNVIDPIIYGGVQSMYKIAEAFGHRDILFIDEAHLVSPDDATMYFKLISTLKAINPYLKIIGMSATPYRIGQGMITDGGLFTDIVHDLTSLENFNKLIADGYLAPLIPKKTNVELDVSNVGIQQGEFNQKQLQHEVDRTEITWKGIQEFLHHAQNRRSGLLYASGIEHAEHIAQMMQQLGAPCAAVHSKQEDSYNDAALKAHKKGELPFIVSYSKLTTGLNHPMVDIIGVFRPTMSVALWVQMLGRGTRIYLGKQNCLVLDFAKNAPRLGPINDPVIPKKKGDKTGTVPIKLCGHCGVYHHIKAVRCDVCGTPFEFEIKITERAGTDELIKEPETVQIDTFDVTYMLYNKKESREGKNPYLKVTYFSGINGFDEYVFPEASYRKHFVDWWRQRHAGEAPHNVDAVLKASHELRQPKRIRVHTNRRYKGRPSPEVLSVEF